MNILIAYDGSAGSNEAVRLVGSVTWPAGTSIHVVSALEPTTIQLPPWPAGGQVPPMRGQDVSLQVEAHLTEVAASLAADDVDVATVLVRDRPASGVIAHATEFGADLIVCGSRGHGSIASLLLGSVSAELVGHAPCPVLVARHPTLERVVFATDGSAASSAAEELLASWPIFEGIPIRVVSVADVVRPWTAGIAPTMYSTVMHAYTKDLADAEANHLAIANEAVVRLVRAGRDATTETRHGDAAAEIIEVAAKAQADLVVLGSRGHSGLRSVVLGSVARNVLSGSDASVLVVHDPDVARP